MNILVIDTASPLEIVAAASGGKTAEASAIAAGSHSVEILDAIGRCLNELGLSAGDLHCIGVGVGPGSFTGIRIAVTTARMLAQVLDIPLVGIPTHLLYAVSVTADAGDNIMIAFDAKKGRVFGALYRKSDSDLAPREIVPPGDYPMDRLVSKIDRSRKTILIGNGIERYGTSLEPVGNRIVLNNFIPSGNTICVLTEKMYLEDPDKWKDWNRVVPCYARKSDAEVARDLKQNR